MCNTPFLSNTNFKIKTIQDKHKNQPTAITARTGEAINEPKTDKKVRILRLVGLELEKRWKVFLNCCFSN